MTKILDILDKRLNPILIKEIRQSMQSKVITAIICLFLLVELVVLSVFLFSISFDSGDLSMGREVFSAILGILLGVSFLFIPLYLGNRFNKERAGHEMELLYTTTIKPSSIIIGKMQSGMLLIILLFSMSLPFLTISYLLRGIDILTIIYISGMSFIAVIPVLQIAIFFGSLVLSKFFQGLARLFALFCSISLISTGIGIYASLSYGGGGAFGSESLIVIGMFTVAVSIVTGLFFMLSIAVISAPSSNRIMPFRIFYACAFILSAIIFSLMWWSTGDVEYMYAFGWSGYITSMLALFITISERDTINSRLKKSVPKNILKRFFVFPFFTGAANGISFFTKTLLLSLIALLSVPVIKGKTLSFSRIDEEFWIPFGIALFLLSYSLFACWIKRLPFIKHFKYMTPSAITLILIILVSVIPSILVFIANPGEPVDIDNNPLYFMISPMGLIEKTSFPYAFFTATSLVVISLMFNYRWLFRQIKEFTPEKKNS